MHGPGHAEVKFVNGEPCLIEIGSRCHGGEGSYESIVNKCVGYNQIDATLDSYFDEAAFNALPERVRCSEITHSGVYFATDKLNFLAADDA